DKGKNKTRIWRGATFGRWRRLKPEKDLKTDAEVANCHLNRVSKQLFKKPPVDPKCCSQSSDRSSEA
ncbi:hypothetical protein D4764_14G0012230, partial [Takifugu flavidus]